MKHRASFDVVFSVVYISEIPNKTPSIPTFSDESSGFMTSLECKPSEAVPL